MFIRGRSNIAAVLSRPRDFAMATACAESLRGMGWDARVMVDPSEWDTPPPAAIKASYAPERRMVGNACFEAIIGGILANSEGSDVVAKFDCDIRLTAEASEWLLSASECARGIRQGNRIWGGMWAAPRAQLAAMAERAPSIGRCRCPESNLSVAGFRHTGGFETHPTMTVAVWMPPREWPADAAALTLPRACRTMSRADAGSAMFDIAPPSRTIGA